MTMFEDRERAFENLFAHEEELRFLALARRNQLFARWAAEQMGLRGSQLQDYIRSFTLCAVRSEAERTLVDRVRTDLIAEGVDTSEQRIASALSVAATTATQQVRTEARLRVD
jgi:hypothetical protein